MVKAIFCRRYYSITNEKDMGRNKTFTESSINNLLAIQIEKDFTYFWDHPRNYKVIANNVIDNWTKSNVFLLEIVWNSLEVLEPIFSAISKLYLLLSNTDYHISRPLLVHCQLPRMRSSILAIVLVIFPVIFFLRQVFEVRN